MVMREWDLPYLFESILKDRKESDMKEPTYPGNSASHNLTFKWKIEIKRYFKEKCKYNDGLFRLWALMNRQGLYLAKTGMKAIKGYT